MAKKTSGEISVKAGLETMTLRLTIAGIEDLEDYFDMSILEIAYSKFNGIKSRFVDMAILYAVMTGRDISKSKDRTEAAQEIFITIGVAVANEAIFNCMMNSLSPNVGDTGPEKRKAAIKARASKRRKVSKKTTEK